jgi:hypothetical protein
MKYVGFYIREQPRTICTTSGETKSSLSHTLFRNLKKENTIFQFVICLLVGCCCCCFDHLRAQRMAASGTARLDVVSSRPIPCHCCSDRPPLPESSSRLLLPSSGFRGVSPGIAWLLDTDDGRKTVYVPPHCPQTYGAYV